MPKFEDLTGQRFGLLTVIKRAENHILGSGKPRTMWTCACECGVVKNISAQSLRQGTTVSCGCYGYRKRLENRVPDDLVGLRFGRLTVKEQAESHTTKSGQIKTRWICLCDCGKEVTVSASNLRQGKTKSCGCYRSEFTVKTKSIDLTGERFGKLVVLSRAESKQYGKNTVSVWRCLCDCGKTRDVWGASLRDGTTVSCGCSRLKIDLRGRRFGMLTVIERSEQNHTKWLCLCACGKYTFKTTGHLISGDTVSCGCKARSSNEIVIAEMLTKMNVPFISEFSFPDLKRPSTGALLRFDFAIVNDNDAVVALIEYQGEQHYTDFKEFGKIQREETDSEKKAYCKKNNIPLYEITYAEETETRCKEIISDIYTHYMSTSC